MIVTPTHYTIVSGAGKGEHALSAFDNALLDAGIGDYNLVKVSSILPPACKFCETIDAPKGSIIFTAFGTVTIQDGEIGSTAVAVAIPDDDKQNGVIFEHHSNDATSEKLVVEMCKNAMGIRSRSVAEIKFSSKTATGESGLYTALISAVAMW